MIRLNLDAENSLDNVKCRTTCNIIMLPLPTASNKTSLNLSCEFLGLNVVTIPLE